MPDFGDELGHDVEQTIKAGTSIIMINALRGFLSDMRNKNYDEYPGKVYPDKSETKSNYAIEDKGDNDYEIFFEYGIDYENALDLLGDFQVEGNEEYNSISLNTIHLDKLTEILDSSGYNEMGRLERLKKSKEELVCLQKCENPESRDAVVDLLRKNGIEVEAINMPANALHYYKKDIPKIEAIVDEYIKSHDSMDIDSRTAVNEIDTKAERGEDFQGSWKEDIRHNVLEARLHSTNEENFIKECESRGVKVIAAKDGEFMFVHSSGNHHKIRADNISQAVTKETFKENPINLDQEAKDMRNAAKVLELFDQSKSQNRDIHQVPNIAK